MAAVYASPEYISTLETSTPISGARPGGLRAARLPDRQAASSCELISAYLNERRPAIASHSVCMECKRRGNVCVMVAHGTACLGPVTHAGCGALCPSYDRGCYGCFGPMEAPNPDSLSGWLADHGVEDVDLVRIYRTFNAGAPAFRDESRDHER